MRLTLEGLALGRQRISSAVIAALWALLASAMLVESDVYRYVTIVLVSFVSISCRKELAEISKAWLALLCYGWALYAFARFVFGLVVYDEKGTSEWLYVFPAFFPFIGVALYRMRSHLFPACMLLVTVGLLGLLVTVDLPQTLEGVRTPPLFHKNPIHAGVGSGLLFISAIFLLLYALETGRLRGQWRWPIIALSVATAFLSPFAILGALSKGVWLALALTALFSSFLCLLLLPGRWRLVTLSGLGITAVVAVAFSSVVVTKVAGTTIAATERLTSRLVAEDLSHAMQIAIADPATPLGMRERLMIWYNALELFSAAPFFGRGNLWLEDWHDAPYSHVGHTLLHNGYLEIIVRHGLFGLAFLALFAAASARRLVAAQREGAIATSTLCYMLTISVFFFCTILTNSNNRLAIGESFFILAGGAIFAVTLLRRQNAAADLSMVDQGKVNSCFQEKQPPFA